MDKIRVAVLGQGRSGRDIHCFNLKSLPDEYEIVAVAEPLEDRRVRAREELKCDVYGCYKELFACKDKIDLVINASPSHLHASITLDLLSNGFNVLCEKPFARTVAEIDEMIAVSEKNNVLLAVFQQSRFNPAFVEAKKIIDTGILGDIIQISMCVNGFARRWDWQTVQDFTAGSLYNTGPHPVDQALRFLDYEGIPDVKCYLRCVNTYGDAEDYVKLILTAPDKPVIDIEIASCCAYPDNWLNVYAKNGGLKSDGKSIQYKYYKPEESAVRELILTPLKKDDGTPAYCTENPPLTWYEESWVMPDEIVNNINQFEKSTIDLYKMIFNVMRKGDDLTITPQQVQQQIAVMEEAHRQCPLPKTVKL